LHKCKKGLGHRGDGKGRGIASAVRLVIHMLTD
jgi:hypothetical protein